MVQRRADERIGHEGTRPVYVISVAAELVRVHPRTLRIYELEGLICPARTPTNIRLYSDLDIRRVLWIRHLTRNLGVNLAGVRVLFELEERLGMRILETLYADRNVAQRTNRRGAAIPAAETGDDAETDDDPETTSSPRTTHSEAHEPAVTGPRAASQTKERND